MYRATEELTKAELDELRNTYWHNIWYGDYASEEQADYEKQFGDLPDWDSDISDEALFWRYQGIGFVRDDFWCNIA